MKRIITKFVFAFVFLMGLWQQGNSQVMISTTDETTICVDGVADPINVTVENSPFDMAAWIITDPADNILGTPPGGPFDLDGAGPGVCSIWYISHDGSLTGNVVGNNISDLMGTFELSNAIVVTRNEPTGGTLVGGPYEFCVGDGEADNIPVGEVMVSGNTGETSQWVVTDDQRNILGLPPMPSAVNFEGAGSGMCYIYNVSYYGDIVGLEMGVNLDDVTGCLSESDNFITVVRNGVNGGMLAGGPYEFCVGDGEADNIPTGEVTVSDNEGETSQWVVTDDQRNILGLPPTPSDVNFDGAGSGMCYIYNVSYNGTVVGLEMGMNLDDVEGCHAESSNFITVVRNEAIGGTLAGGPYEFCVGDGEADNIPVGEVTVSGNTGETSQWVVTDDQRNILGLPPMPSAVNFEGAGSGMCYIYNVSYYGDIVGLEMGVNLDDVAGCLSESDNFITVVRNEVNGGMVAGGPYEFCVGDGEADNIPTGEVTVSDNEGEISQWVVTDDQRNILGLPPTPSDVNFDGAGSGMCYIYNVSYNGTVVGLEMGMNLDDVEGCHAESSNFITVVRNEAIGGTLAGGPYEFCVGDGEADNIPVGEVTVSGNTGETSQWVVTDDQRNILGLPPMPSAVDFEGAGSGMCYIYNVSYYGDIVGLEMGVNLDDVTGCLSESDNFITVVRNGVNGGMLAGGPYDFCVGDGEADNIPTGEVTVSDNEGETSQWVVTDDQRNILGLPPTPSDVNFDGAGSGMCYIYNVSYNGTVVGLEMGMNLDDVEGCHAESSNFITVVRNEAIGGTLAGGPYEFCVGDGTADNIPVGEVTVSGNTGETSQWVVTDDQRNILGLPPMPSAVDFDGAGSGMCYIYNVSYYGDLVGLEMGVNLDDVTGCLSESDNFITVVRNTPVGGTLAGGPYEFCVGDGTADNIPTGEVTVSGNTGETSQWVVTDDQRNILGLPPTPEAANFEGAPGGMCYIYNVSFYGDLIGLEMGMNLDDVEGCLSESENFITVIRNEVNGGSITTMDTTTICVDGTADPIDVTVEGAIGPNSQWIITNDTFEILAKPAGPPFDLDGAGPGTCLIWYVRFTDVLEGDTVGAELDEIIGCYDLSDSIVVVRNEATGGTLAGGPYEFCVSDGIADNIPAGEVTVTDNVGEISQWVVTDDQRNILGLPPTPSAVNFEDAPGGMCYIYNVSYYGDLAGLDMGANLDNLEGCYSESDNFITVIRNESIGGTISTTDATTICVDGIPDPIDVTLTGEAGENSAWVITDLSLNILGLPAAPPFDLDGAGPGVCQIWHLSFADGLEGAAVGMNAGELVGCYDLSNPITVIRNESIGGTISTTDETTICVDGTPDPIDVTLTGEAGQNSAWVITDESLNILGLPAAPPFDLDGAGAGTCLIWHLSFADGLEGAAVGMNAGDLEGCFDLSNSITVVRNESIGGTISTTDETTICVDGTPDPINVSLTGEAGQNSAWVITDESLNILGLPAAPPFDLDGAGTGVCLIWHLSFADGLEGAAEGMNAEDLEGCFELSNPITVTRDEVDGGSVSLIDGSTLYGGCPGEIVVEVQNTSENTYFDYYYVITDDNDNILELVDASVTSILDLSAAPAGECHIYGWNTIGSITPVPGENISSLQGENCEELSDNYITILRQNADGGEIELQTGGTSYEGCAGDLEFDLTFQSSAFMNYWFVVTDDNSNILAWFNSDFGGWIDINGAPPGVCRIYGWSERGQAAPVAGAHITSLNSSCGDISENWVTITRLDCDPDCTAEAATISTTDDTSICVDGNPDPINVTVEGGAGMNSAWVITDADGNILGLPAAGPFDLDGAGEGTCLIWYLNYDDVEGAEVGMNANDLSGCFELSNPITVTRETANGGTVSLANGGITYSNCAGDIVFDVEHETTALNLSYWYIITDNNDNILGFHNSADGPTLDLSGAPAGECHIWGWSYSGESDPIMGENISTLTDGDCEEISGNFITVNRETPDGGTVMLAGGGDVYSNCAGDIVFDVEHETTAPNLSYWYIITDDNDNILAFHNSADGPTLDLSGAPAGECHVWGWNYKGLEDPIVGENISTLTDDFCEAVSDNFITVNRETPDGGTVFLADGTEAATFVAGDVVFDVQHETTAPNLSYWYIITDDNDNILAFHNSTDGPTLDLSGAPAGECHIWGWNYKGLEDPIVGENISTLTDDFCEAISDNFITITREESPGPVAATISTTDDTSICVDGNPDPINVTVEGGSGTNSAWVITDVDGNILGLPATGPFDLDGAGEGTCLIWLLNFENVEGAEVGMNANDLTGEFALSNPITVYREAANGGTVSLTDGSTEGTFIAGDVVFDVQHETTAPNLSYWYIITDDNDNILAFHNSADGPTLDLSGAPAGECHIWGWSYSGESDPVVGENISTLTDGDCEAISDNFITINREEPGTVLGATISTMDDTTICVDGNPDPINVTVEGGTGDSSAYVITDADGMILGLPAMGPFDLDGAGEGICLLWHLSYNDVEGAEVGMNANDLTGNFALSNPITVTRQSANGGVVALTNGLDTATYCVGSAIFDVEHVNTATALSYWYIITDNNDNILGYHNSADGPTLDLSEAPAGECHIWGWSYKGEPNPVMGENISTLSDGDCEAISENFISIFRAEGLVGGTISTEDSVIACPGDGSDDVVNITTTGGGDAYAYILTDENDVIIGTATLAPTFNFEGSEPGIRRIYGVGYAGTLEVGNTIQEVGGNGGSCAVISENFIEVVIQETADCFSTSTTDETIGDVKVYPNPAVNFITLEYNNLSNNAVASIIDMQGRRVSTQNISGANGEVRIDVNNLSRGLYLVQVKSNEELITKRIVLTK